MAQLFDELTLSGRSAARNLVGCVTQGSQNLALGLAIVAASQLVEGSDISSVAGSIYPVGFFHSSLKVFLHCPIPQT